ncbi:MAG TPA: response regulator, partial [Chthoniobacteraceae bacterium]|nr:response regulator [Chthoniobacteraceae bacterium]
IESGTVSVDLSDFSVDELVEGLDRTFRHLADRKGLRFDVQVDPALPKSIHTDAQRLDQILKNLLSNAFKFTEGGTVELRIAPAESGWSEENSRLNEAPAVVAFAVSDSGIGIPVDKQGSIFEAFQQADGSTSRKYGGTGLGLAISREIARLLGGEIRLTSTPEQGSTFTLYLPQEQTGRRMVPPQRTDDADSTAPVTTINGSSPEIAAAGPAHDTGETTTLWGAPGIADDRAVIAPHDRTILIIEDDIDFAAFEMEVVRERGLKALVATRGHAGLALAREYHPDGILLDITLPDISGWKVLERLKDDLGTRHIPVFVISANDEPENALKHGAVCFRKKPISRPQFEEIVKRLKVFPDKPRHLLVVEDDDSQRRSIEELIGNGTANLVSVATGSEALGMLRDQEFDGLVLDLLLPDISGFDLMHQIRREHPELPIIVYTGKELSADEETELNRVAQTVIVKDVRSPERLYDQATLWLHRKVQHLPDEKREILTRLHSEEGILSGRKVLLVDDDVRNIFAMTSFLERYQMDVVPAETGAEAIAALENQNDIEIVLMDIMLPEMDGYETMRQIRARHGFKELPIIALTAKAMRGDREKCIEAGASDYIAKPVDTEKLVSMLRMWLHR